MNNNKDYENEGMRYPSVDQLSNKTSSKYKLIIGTALRAKEITAGSPVLIKNHESKKSIGIALEEVLADKVIIK